MIPYSLHVALLLAVCLLFYKLLLQKETYYRLNRVVLLTCLALAFALPLIPVPRKFSLQNTEPAPATVVALPEEKFDLQTGELIKSAPDVKATQANPTPVKVTYQSATVTKVPASTKTAPVSQQAQKKEAEHKPLLPEILKWAFRVYWCGVVVFGINLLIQVIALLIQGYKKPSIKDGIFRIVELDTDKAPCSFGKSIFINPEKYDWETYNQILLHEKVHIQQGHSFDLILAELMLVVQWFNPFAWLYRKELESNLEFLTDDSVLHDHGVGAEDYAMSLLKVSIPNFSMRITTNYNQSLLKKRIVMMNAKRSNIHTMWKYFMLMPLLAVLVCGLNKPIAAVAQQTFYRSNGTEKRTIDFSNGLWFAAIKNDRINIEFRSDDNDENHNWTSSHTFDLKDLPNLPKGDKGDFTLTREAGSILFNGKFDGEQGYGHYKFTVNADYKAFVAKEKIDGIDGDDDYFQFFMSNVTKSYLEFLANNGFKDLPKYQIMNMAYQKVDAAYIKSWQDLGYKDLTAQQLTSLKSMKIDADYVNSMKKAGFPDLTIQQLISFKSQHVTADYINGLKKATVNLKGAPELTPRDVISSKSQHIDSAYVSSFAGTNYSVSNYGQLGSLKSQNITPEYIKSFEAVGLTNLSPGELMSLKSQNITPEYVKEFKDLGYSADDIKRLVSMKRNGITPEYIKGFGAVGYKNIPVNSLYGIQAAKVTPEDVKGYVSLGYTPAATTVSSFQGTYNNSGTGVSVATGIYNDAELRNRGKMDRALTLGEVGSLKQQGITPEYVKSFQDIGYGKDVPLTTYRQLKSAGITPDYVKSFEAVGYKNVPYNSIVTFKSQGITPEFVKSFVDLGYTNMPYNYVSAFKSRDITPEYIKGFEAVGYKTIPYNNVLSFKATGITPDFVKSFQAVGYTNIPYDYVVMFKVQNVTPEYVKTFEALGYKNIHYPDLISLKNQGITPEFISGFTKLGFTDIPLSQLTYIKRSGVTPEFVTEMKQKGFDSKDLQKYVELKNFNSDADARSGQIRKAERLDSRPVSPTNNNK